MENQDIKNLLLSVQAVEQKQAEQREWRSWTQLRQVLFSGEPVEEPASAWGNWMVTLGAVATVAVALGLMAVVPVTHTDGPSYAQARQQGLSTSIFYSAQAHADVVWISGLQSAETEETSNTP